MAKKRKKGGGGSKLLCGCFGTRDEVPDIQVDTTTSEKLKSPPMAEAITPMPPPVEWRSKFVELVVSLCCSYIPCLTICCQKQDEDLGYAINANLNFIGLKFLGNSPNFFS